jgi:hypothetical protein
VLGGSCRRDFLADIDLGSLSVREAYIRRRAAGANVWSIPAVDRRWYAFFDGYW